MDRWKIKFESLWGKCRFVHCIKTDNIFSFAERKTLQIKSTILEKQLFLSVTVGVNVCGAVRVVRVSEGITSVCARHCICLCICLCVYEI